MSLDERYEFIMRLDQRTRATIHDSWRFRKKEAYRKIMETFRQRWAEQRGQKARKRHLQTLLHQLHLTELDPAGSKR